MMYCKKCGENIREDDVFCPSCGTPVPKENQNNNEVNNMYTYERPVNQQMNYNQQQPKQTSQLNYGQNGQAYKKNKNTSDIIKIVVGTLIGLVIVVPIIWMGVKIISQPNPYKKENNSEIVDNNSSISNTTTTNNNSGSSTTLNNNSSNSSINNSTNTLTNSTSNNSTNTTNNNSSGLTQTTNNRTSMYTVNYAGFKLTIPDNLLYAFNESYEIGKYDEKNQSLNIGDIEQTWVAQLNIQKVQYQQYKQNKSSLHTNLNQQLSKMGINASIKPATVETIDGVEFIILESNIGGASDLVAIASLNSMYSMFIDLYNEDNDFNRDNLKNITPIIKNAEYTGTSSYMKTNEKINIKDITKALEKAIEE